MSMCEKQAYTEAPNMDGLYISRSFADINDPKDTKHSLELYFDNGSSGKSVRVRGTDGEEYLSADSPKINTVGIGGLFCGFRWTAGYADNGIIPYNDLFSEYHSSRWKEWIGLSYSVSSGASIDSTKLKRAHIITCSMWLSSDDFSGFDFGDKILLDTEYGTSSYRILKITGFDPYLRKPCQVKLIKIV